MIYWHVEKKSTCIYSRLKSCSSSEVAAMIEGLLRHCTDAEIEKNYVDTHGQSEVAFAFCHLLGFRLLPRLKNISSQKLYRPDAGNPSEYEHLQQILTRPINWDPSPASMMRWSSMRPPYAWAPQILKLSYADLPATISSILPIRHSL